MAETTGPPLPASFSLQLTPPKWEAETHHTPEVALSSQGFEKCPRCSCDISGKVLVYPTHGLVHLQWIQ